MKKGRTTVQLSREIEQKGREIGQKGRSFMLFAPSTEKKTAPAELFSPLVLLGA
jgi:hypothetical protein